MRLLEPNELIDGVRWWELAGHHDHAALVDAWRQVHYASQAAAELGKGWAEAIEDDSHSTLLWVPDTSRLQDQFFAGQLAEGRQHARALLRPWDMKLFLIDQAGSPMVSTDLVGRSLAEAMEWVREAGDSLVGDPRQDARPAPDLPAHPLGDGGSFGEPNQLAIAEVIRFYSNADALLGRLAELIEMSDAPKTWPHHFDIATLATIRTDPDGSMNRTIGIGLTPPDTLCEQGYWYVSPWAKDPSIPDPAWPELPHGAWVDRGGPLRMAVLPIGEVTSTEDPAEQHARVGAFVASAYNACRRIHQHG